MDKAHHSLIISVNVADSCKCLYLCTSELGKAYCFIHECKCLYFCQSELDKTIELFISINVYTYVSHNWANHQCKCIYLCQSELGKTIDLFIRVNVYTYVSQN